MSLKFRTTHLFQILSQFEEHKTPFDVFLRMYFKEHKSIGSHDRKYLAETLYGLMRWLGLIDFFCGENKSWENRIQVFSTLEPEAHLDDKSIPLHQRVSFPEEYFDVLSKHLGEEKAKLFCLESNRAAPTTIRVNTLKTSREGLLHQLSSVFSCYPGKHSPHAIHFPQRINFFTLPEFKEGCFEVQDEASQLVASQVGAQPGNQVLDYCAGSGGKALAIAPNMQGKGQLYLHDVRPHALIEAKKRLKRAGIQNAQLISPQTPQKNKLKGKMDWVLVDAPCSGSGTLRRNPDMKWKFQESDLEKLLLLQREIFEEALAFVKPEGHIVYATCSVLPLENELQTQFFLQQNPFLRQSSFPFSSSPQKGEMDGFYAVTFQKKKLNM
ncbi:MAG: RsmB/NOP family class I SAM-dependent RNA methyltransferase [Chlamydiae bacterium]|nr:RsmB/NOP family class I SAM-dependent RNA methyltransferase [Chlamydiota bacterium]